MREIIVKLDNSFESNDILLIFFSGKGVQKSIVRNIYSIPMGSPFPIKTLSEKLFKYTFKTVLNAINK